MVNRCVWDFLATVVSVGGILTSGAPSRFLSRISPMLCSPKMFSLDTWQSRVCELPIRTDWSVLPGLKAARSTAESSQPTAVNASYIGE
jgi:hypothetical protein